MSTTGYVFDVNETLVDMRPLDPLIERVLDVPGQRALWFATVLRSAFAHTLVDRPTPAFGDVAAAALEVLAAQRSRPFGEAERSALGDALATLPLHPDVEPALRRLRDDGARLVVCAQAAEASLRAQLADVADCVDAWVSASDLGAFKPADVPYRAALRALDGADATMVAAHPWDLAGAGACGLRTVLVARPGVVSDPLFAAPDRVVEDLRQL